MGNVTNGIILVVVGLTIIIFRKWLVDGSLDFQDRVYGLHVGGEKSRKLGYWLMPSLGIGVVIAGLLTLLGIIK